MIKTPPLPNKKYSVILADCPWNFETYSDNGKDRSADRYYNIMTKEEIRELPVQEIVDDNCILFLWVTYPCLIQGLELIIKWGFTYKTNAFTWVKKNKSNLGFHMGMGYWTRANSEICLLATKGKPKRKKDGGGGVRQLIVSPVREHSRKPDEQYDRIEALVKGPYIELFARQKKKGWDSWGLEVNKFGGK